MDTNYLMHHGIKGQKWGVRRYQNEDGSYTAAGRERYDSPPQTLSRPKKKQDSTGKKIGKSVAKAAVKATGRTIGTELGKRVAESILESFGIDNKLASAIIKSVVTTVGSETCSGVLSAVGDQAIDKL